MITKRGQWWIWTQVGLWLIAILIIVVGGISIWQASKISAVMKEQGQQVAQTLERTNALLDEYQKFPSQVAEINEKIARLEMRTTNISLNAARLQRIEDDFVQHIEILNDILTQLRDSQKKIAELQNKYPPVQTQNILFQNMSNAQASTLIQNAINQRSKSLIITFAFGSLIGISFSLLSVYLIFNHKKRRESK